MPPTRGPLGSVVGSILGTTAPVLLVDTCALLDVVRSFDTARSDVISAALRIVVCGAAPLQVVIQEEVLTEYANNKNEVENEIRKFLTRADDLAARYFSVRGKLLGVPVAPVPGFGDDTVISKAGMAADALIKIAHQLDNDDAATLRGSERIRRGTPPAAKGSGARDAFIYEHYVELIRRVRAGGGKEKVVFCSSNTKDFMPGGRLAPEIERDFNSIGIDYARNLEEALRILGI